MIRTALIALGLCFSLMSHAKAQSKTDERALNVLVVALWAAENCAGATVDRAALDEMASALGHDLETSTLAADFRAHVIDQADIFGAARICGGVRTLTLTHSFGTQDGRSVVLNNNGFVWGVDALVANTSLHVLLGG